MQSLGVVWCLAIISSTRVMANPASHVVDNARLESREARESIIILAEEDISNPEPESYVTMKPTSNIYDYDLQEAEQAEIDRFLQHFYQAPANEDTSEDTNFNTDQYGDEAYDSYLDQDNQGGEGSRFSSKLHPDNYYFVNKDNYLKYIHELERQNRRREEDARNDNILEEIEDDESPLMGRFRREASNLYDTIKSKSVINKGLNKNGVASYDHADCRGRSGGSGGGGGIPGGNGRVPGESGGVPGGNSGGAGGAGGNGVDVDGAGEDGGAGGVDEGGVDAGGDVEGVEGDDGTETNELRQRLVNRINRRRVSRQRRRGFKTSDEELQ